MRAAQGGAGQGLIECGSRREARLCLSGKERAEMRQRRGAPGADVEACAPVPGDSSFRGCRWSDWPAEWQRAAQVSAVPRIDAAVSVHLLPFCSAPGGRLRLVVRKSDRLFLAGFPVRRLGLNPWPRCLPT